MGSGGGERRGIGGKNDQEKGELYHYFEVVLLRFSKRNEFVRLQLGAVPVFALVGEDICSKEFVEANLDHGWCGGKKGGGRKGKTLIKGGILED